MTFSEQGIEIIRDAITEPVMTSILDEVEQFQETMPAHGIRHAEKKFPSILRLIESESIIALARQYLCGEPQKVRTIFFDKTPEKNWLVIWHQDKTVAVSKPFDMPGWGPWTQKEGIDHVQPTLDVLNKMVTFRIHLDDADEDNGCLRVIPGSARMGVLSQEAIYEITANSQILDCVVKAGDIVVMRPHILHASRKSVQPSHRRVVHVEFSTYQLPDGIRWA